MRVDSQSGSPQVDRVFKSLDKLLANVVAQNWDHRAFGRMAKEDGRSDMLADRHETSEAESEDEE